MQTATPAGSRPSTPPLDPAQIAHRSINSQGSDYTRVSLQTSKSKPQSLLHSSTFHGPRTTIMSSSSSSTPVVAPPPPPGVTRGDSILRPQPLPMSKYQQQHHQHEPEQRQQIAQKKSLVWGEEVKSHSNSKLEPPLSMLTQKPVLAPMSQSPPSPGGLPAVSAAASTSTASSTASTSTSTSGAPPPSPGASRRSVSFGSKTTPILRVPGEASCPSPPMPAHDDLPDIVLNTDEDNSPPHANEKGEQKLPRRPSNPRTKSYGRHGMLSIDARRPLSIQNSSALPPNISNSRSPGLPAKDPPPASRPLLNRYYSTPVNPMSPARQHFRLHNPVPHHVKETPTIRYLEDARGRFINQYQITRVVGRGSFGMVYLAVDNQGQRYALKECSKRRLAKLNRAALMRLRRNIVTRGNAAPTSGEISSIITREIAVMKKLDHPNLVTLFEVLDDPDSESLILVLEWCPGGTIMLAEEDYNGNATAIPEPKSRLYFRDLILGVEYLHARGVCHRDIKADNVLLGEGDVVKIADFGVSEIFDLTKNELDSVQRPVGSLAYMSPELVVLQCGPAVDGIVGPAFKKLHPAHAPISGRKADIWAMGVTLYYMVHGRLPFEAKDVNGLHVSILTTEPDVSTCTPELADLFRKIFTKAPENRITLLEIRNHPWVTQNGLDPLLPVEENVQVSDDDRITEEDLRNAIDQITHREGAPRLDYGIVSKSLRTNYGWHGSTTGSEASSGSRTPHYSEREGSATPSNPSPHGSLKMEKLSRALEELFHFREGEKQEHHEHHEHHEHEHEHEQHRQQSLP